MDILSRLTGDASRLDPRLLTISAMRTLLFALAFGVVLVGWAFAAAAQDTSSSEQRPDLNADSVQQRLDRRVPALLDTHAVPGAVVAVVTGSQIVSVTGYGFSNAEEEQPMSGDRSVVRVASVTKPVTATLLRILAARGDISLDDPVGRDIVDREAGDDVTLAHLLAHTSGLDGRMLGGGSPRPPASLTSVVRRQLPPQIDPAGAVSRYSNEGYAWAGAVVAEKRGESFAALADSLLFRPLQMRHSTFAADPKFASGTPATGYVPGNDAPEALPRDYVTMVPAGGLWTTGADMARFLQAVLNGGRQDTVRVLPSEAVSFEPGDLLDPFAGRRGHLGWFRGVVSGHDAYVHKGSYPGAGSQVAIIPELKLGVFVAGNAASGVPLASDVLREILANVPSPHLSMSDAVQTDLGTLEGTYRIARRPHTSFESFFSLFGIPYPDVEVVAEGDTALTLGLPDGPLHLRHVGQQRFQTPNRSVAQAAAITSGPGPVPRLRVGNATFERIPLLATAAVSLPWFGICLLAIASIFIIPIREFMRPNTSDDDAPEGMQYARPLATFAAALHVGFLFALAFRVFTGGPLGPTHTDPASIRPLLAFPIMASALSVGLLGFVIRAWITKAWSPLTRIHFSIVTAGMLAYIPFLWYWNLIGSPVA
ncbi:serine hydrolase domain-containing protein [Longibacter sp.]|uniref:serine hydrolase domain-containing protein n=1 Tax=Longibacter sp. TaxID=2045415 RepID=UPI003EC0CDA2